MKIFSNVCCQIVRFEHYPQNIPHKVYKFVRVYNK